MGSVGNQNPWPPYNNFRDCTQGICSIYCPQWCYIIFPPPPPFTLGEDDGDSGTDFSPLIIAVIGILASAFILVSYYTIISKYCRRRNDESVVTRDQNSDQNNDSWQNNTVTGGLDESLIKSITVCKFMKNDGFVESSDCSVCLSEFQENESLRLLPKCNHAFHISCIDTWLKSHASCPLCRAHIVSTHILAEQPPAVAPPQRPVAQLGDGYVRPISDTSIREYQFRMQNGIHIIQDLEMGIVEEVVEQEHEDEENIEPKLTRNQEFRNIDLQMRRSISLNSSSMVRQCDRVYSIAEILQVNEDGGDDDDENYQMRDLVKNNNNKIGILNLVRSPLAMRRSRSYVFTRYEKGKSSSINIS